MKSRSRTNITVSELYALERAARAARSQEVVRLIRAGADALVRFAGRALSVLDHRKEISHA